MTCKSRTKSKYLSALRIFLSPQAEKPLSFTINQRKTTKVYYNDLTNSLRRLMARQSRD